MIVVDTNVWSELLKPAREPNVIDWIEHNGSHLVLSSIVLGELRFFVAKQDDGRRKQAMANTLATIEMASVDRFVGFGSEEASAYGELMARMRRSGTTLPAIDGWIAAQALAHGYAVATRNTYDFERTGLTLIDPWTA